MSQIALDLQGVAVESFKKWNEALLSKDPKKVAELYDVEASFLPTLNPEFKRGQHEAEEYFEHFLLKKPSGTVIKDAVQELAQDANGETKSFLHSGLYNFEVGEDGGRQTVEARFTFVWKKNEEGEWKILHHHSSLRPMA